MNKQNNDLYQRMHGFKTVKRGYLKKGQSEWYYIDPRYDDERWQIDVANENSPNPKLNSILTDDMKKNPENYYIWRTKKDSKVRGAHAAREGMIFNKHIPPDGGHPGEDYNCRCWAEPFEPEKYIDKPMIVDVSGLDMFKELSKALKPDILNTKNSTLYAANDKSNIATDAGYENSDEYPHRKVEFRSPQEEKLLRRIGKQIVARENTKEYAYLDSSGYITTGNGALINDWESFKKVHWLYNGRPATED